MKKLAVFFFMLAIVLTIAYAETGIFSGKIITDYEKIIDGKSFKFLYDEPTNKVFVQTPLGALIVENGACNSNGAFKVCVHSANFSYKNITTYVFYYEVDASIYKLTGSLSTNSSNANPSTVLQGELFQFTRTITNPTNFDITSIAYKEDLSPFAVTEAKGCDLDGSSISWKGSLKSKYDKTCTATLIGNKEGSYSLSGLLTYFNSFETENKTSSAVNVKVLPKQLKVTQTIDKIVEIKRPFYINMSLKNINDAESIDADITIDIPNKINLLKNLPDFSSELDVLRRRVKLQAGYEFNYSLYLNIMPENQMPVTQTFDYTIKSVRDKIENSTYFASEELKPIIELSSEYPILAAGQKFILFVKIKNPNLLNRITDIKAKLNVPYNEEVAQSLSILMPNETYPIINSRLEIPKSADIGPGNQTIQINVGIEYKFYDALKSVNKSFELKIKQEQKAILSADNATNATLNISDIKKEENVQSTAIETKPANKTSVKTPQVKDLNVEETTISESFNKESLYMVAVILTIFVAITITISKIRKKTAGVESDKNASNEIKDETLK